MKQIEFDFMNEPDLCLVCEPDPESEAVVLECKLGLINLKGNYETKS